MLAILKRFSKNDFAISVLVLFFFQIPFCIAFAIQIAAKESRNEILHMAPKAEILLSLGRLKGATIIDS